MPLPIIYWHENFKGCFNLDYKYLSGIKSPQDVKTIKSEDIPNLCEEIRNCIIDTVSKNGGHLASNLGAVELTVALHRVFSAPQDSIIFDVGHQSYAHKLLTGRFEQFSTIRTEGGLSGFMRPNESEYDAFVTGHSSNSISAAYGIYTAKQLKGEEGTAIAVIGDGAMTGGLAYEALNNAGNNNGNFIVVLNDNTMSISKNVGSMARAFTKLRNRPRYHKLKFAFSNIIEKIPLIGQPTYKALFKFKEFIKSTVYRNNIFSAMGFNYLGPVDGHDVPAMESILKIAKSYNKPCLVHVVTTKGKGYLYAENSPKNYHGVSPFDVENGAVKCEGKSFSQIAGNTLCGIAEFNDSICAVTAAMKSGTALTGFAEKYPDRFFDVGIAEQHAATFCAGLAKGGMTPFFAVYSTFLQRGFDQLIHDTAIENLPIKLLVDRAGVVGEDGESHQGIFDVSFLSLIPNINIYSPSFYNELEREIIKTSLNDEFCAIRYPRGCEISNFSEKIEGDYTFVYKNDSKDNLLITYGRIFSNAVNAVKVNNSITVLKLNKIYPIEKQLVSIIKDYKNIHFFEEGIKSGGIAEHIGSLLAEIGYKGEYTVHAIENEFVPQATISSSLKKYNLDTDAMLNAFND